MFNAYKRGVEDGKEATMRDLEFFVDDKLYYSNLCVQKAYQTSDLSARKDCLRDSSEYAKSYVILNNVAGAMRIKQHYKEEAVNRSTWLYRFRAWLCKLICGEDKICY